MATPRKPSAAAEAAAPLIARKSAAKAASPGAAPAGAARAGTEAAAKARKADRKLVRDSFAMPGGDFALIQLLKDRALGFRRPTKKSELLRAGLHALAALSDRRLHAALDALEPLKPGRPRNVA